MKTLVAIVAIMFIALAIACGDEEEELVSATTSEPTATATSEVPTQTPEPTASSISATPVPTGTPEPTAVPNRTPPPEPDEQQTEEVRSIYQTLPALPDNGNWKIVWTGEPAIGMFQVWVINPSTNAEFVDWMEKAQGWFVENGHDPCEYPLAGLIGYTSDGPYPPDPTDLDWLEDPWEPCSDNY